MHSEFPIDLIASGRVHSICFKLNTSGALHFIKWNHKAAGDQNDDRNGIIRKIRVRRSLA